MAEDLEDNVCLKDAHVSARDGGPYKGVDSNGVLAGSQMAERAGG